MFLCRFAPSGRAKRKLHSVNLCHISPSLPVLACCVAAIRVQNCVSLSCSLSHFIGLGRSKHTMQSFLFNRPAAPASCGQGRSGPRPGINPHWYGTQICTRMQLHNMYHHVAIFSRESSWRSPVFDQFLTRSKRHIFPVYEQISARQFQNCIVERERIKSPQTRPSQLVGMTSPREKRRCVKPAVAWLSPCNWLRTDKTIQEVRSDGPESFRLNVKQQCARPSGSSLRQTSVLQVRPASANRLSFDDHHLRRSA